jgi:hypothetical protein
MNTSRKRLFDDVLQLYGARAADLVTSVLNNERFIQGVQRLMQASLEFRDFLQRAVSAALEQINLPTREDLDRLHELLLTMDERLDGIERQLERISTPSGEKSAQHRRKADKIGEPT